MSGNEIEIKKLKEIRERLNLSQVVVAKELGVTKQYYNKVEKGLTSLSKDKAVELCKVFGISFEWFFGDGKQMMLKDEEISENFIQDTDNLNNLNTILKAYNIYLKEVFKAVKKRYKDADFDDITKTANILFNQDCLKEKISFTDLKSVQEMLSKDEDAMVDFETRARGTYFPITVYEENVKEHPDVNWVKLH